MKKIERLKGIENVNGRGDSLGVEPPNNLIMMNKINEIIDYLNMDIHEDLKGTDMDGGVKGDKGEQGLTE